MLAWLTSCDAELPLRQSVDVTVEVAWDSEQHGFRLTGTYSMRDEEFVIEQGFCYAPYAGDDIGKYRGQMKTVVDSYGKFEYLLDEEMWNPKSPAPYIFFAYVYTKSGYYRSETKRVNRGSFAAPVVTSATYSHSLGELYIEGHNFPTDRNRVRVYADSYEVVGYPSEYSRTAMRLNYRTNRAGTHWLKVVMDGNNSSNSVEFQVDGITIDSITPALYYLGEEVTIHTSGISIMENFETFIPNNFIYSIESMSTNEMKIRIYSDVNTVCIRDKKYRYYSNHFKIEPYSPWEQKKRLSEASSHSKSVALLGKNIYYYECSMDEGNSYQSTLYCYNVDSGEEKKLKIKEESDEYIALYPSLLVYKDDLYVVRRRYDRQYTGTRTYHSDPFFNGYRYLGSDLCRISLSTGELERTDIPGLDNGDEYNYIAKPLVDEDSGIMYLRVEGKDLLLIYDIESKTWSSCSLPMWWTTPKYCRNGYFYYVQGTTFCRAKIDTSPEILYDHNLFMPESSYNYYSMDYASIIDGKFYFYRNTILFSVPFSDDMASQRPTAYGATFGIDITSSIVVPHGDELYIAGSTVWQFTPK
jgi:hypothetical protein